MVATGNFVDAWLYTIAPLVGAFVAAGVHGALVWLVQEQAAAAARTPAE
jgi:uncharacterized membrane protein